MFASVFRFLSWTPRAGWRAPVARHCPKGHSAGVGLEVQPLGQQLLVDRRGPERATKPGCLYHCGGNGELPNVSRHRRPRRGVVHWRRRVRGVCLWCYAPGWRPWPPPTSFPFRMCSRTRTASPAGALVTPVARLCWRRRRRLCETRAPPTRAEPPRRSPPASSLLSPASTT